MKIEYYPNRKVTVYWPSPDALEELLERTDVREFYKALGYLTQWAYSRDYEVSIEINPSDSELTAIYNTPSGEREMVIGAVWREYSRQFTFHS